jgi:hypothetical protein
MLSSVLFRSIEPRLREWQAAQPVKADSEPAPASKTAVDSLGAKLAGVEEQNAKLEKKLSMAMGAIQAATAQIVQLRQELEQSSNLSRQAMQKATSAQSTAESAAEGLEKLEDLATRPNLPGGAPPEGAPATPDPAQEDTVSDVGADDAPHEATPTESGRPTESGEGETAPTEPDPG